MTDYMLTVRGGLGFRDVQVNNAGDIREAIAVAEAVMRPRRVDHGRGGIGSAFNPAIVIDCESGDVESRHDREALTSMTLVKSSSVRAIQAVLASNARRAKATS